MDRFENIIVRMPNWLGDMVMATPILRDLRVRFEKANITAMCLKQFSPLLFNNPYINEIFTFSPSSGFLRREESRDVIFRLRQGHFDLGLLLTNSFSSAFWFWRGKVSMRVGYKNDGRSLLLNKAISWPKERGREHLVTTYKRLLSAVDIPLSASKPELFVTEQEKHVAKEWLRQRHVPKGAKLIGINPTATFGPAKCWPGERYRKAALELVEADRDVYILFFGDLAAESVVREICQGLPSRVINLAGLTSLRELISLISICDLLLTNDSGPMHIADALNVPIVALFGSTDSKVTGPYSGGKVITKEVSCAPCFRRVCPIDFPCMKKIEVDEVVSATLNLLKK